MSSLFSAYSERPTLAALAVLIGTVLLALWVRRDRRLDSIPGPRGRYPLIGIGYKLPTDASALFQQWAGTYGDIFKLRVGWYDWVVINSPEAISEIIEKQSAKTASKQPSPMGHDIVTGGNRMPTMPYGPHWRILRSIVRQVTSAPNTATFVPSQEFETKQLLFDLATDNANQRDFFQHTRRFAFSIIMTNTFGTRIKSWDHPDVQNAMVSQSILRQTSIPGAFLIDELPILAHLPSWLQPGRRRALAAAKVVHQIKMDLWTRIREQVEAGTASHCYARDIFEGREAWYAKGGNEALLAWVSGGLVEAGFSTTAGTLNSAVLYLAANPHVQDLAQAEIMRAVGPSRMPTFEDAKSLPYIRACVQEVLRMNPIVVPGVRHFAAADVVYKQHVIPKGTVLLVNTAFLHNDPRRYPEPAEFKPERFLDGGGGSADNNSDLHKRDHFAFSTGRRTCPGAQMAENSLSIALAGILWAFEIRPPLQPDGTEAKMDLSDNAYLDTGFTLPKPFAARFVVRDAERMETVKKQWEEASEKGYELRGRTVDIEGITI